MRKNRTLTSLNTGSRAIQPASVARHVYGTMFSNKHRSKEMKEQLRALMLINHKTLAALN